MKYFLRENKNKIGTIAICGALFIATTGTAVFANTPVSTKLFSDGKDKVVSSQKLEMSTLISKGKAIFALFDKDGNVKNVPLQKVEGDSALANDKTKLSSDAPFLTQSSGNVVVMVKMEKGVMLYSTDFGKTWSKNAPVDEDIANDKTKKSSDVPFLTQPSGSIAVMVKMEKGVMLYSTDSGKTWSENAPVD